MNDTGETVMSEFIYKIGDYTLEYIIDGDNPDSETGKEITITGYRGNGSLLEIPGTIAMEEKSFYVTAIGKKAFLGNCSLRRVLLPCTVSSVGDWAFAQCANLHTVVVRGSVTPHFRADICFGKGVFEDCSRMSDICLGYEDCDALSALLGAVPDRMQAEYLLQAGDIGSIDWFGKWDGRLVSFLDEDDEEGYTNVVLCGEEDIQRSVPGFMSDKRKRKSALCLLRLLHDRYLGEENRKIFTSYLLAHNKGCETEEAWEVILSDFGDNMAYYTLFAEIGGIREENINSMLEDMGTKHAEAKAYLIDYQQKNYLGKDIFDSFEI